MSSSRSDSGSSSSFFFLVLSCFFFCLLFVEKDLVVVGVHHIEVVLAGEDDPLLVGRDGRPFGVFGWGFEVGELADLTRTEIVLEMKDFLFRLAFGLL